MRKQYLVWSIVVFGLIGTGYGATALIYNSRHGKELPVAGLVLLILGVIALMLISILGVIDFLHKLKNTPEPVETVQEPEDEEEVEETAKEEKSTVLDEKTYQKPAQDEKVVRLERTRVSYDSSSRYASTAYVKQVGYGPLLRVDGNRIFDMRNNTYYRIENNYVKQEGYGPLYEISGNQIKNAFGGYLYELSGSNINKVYGGFYASISGNYITLYDLSIKYEMTDSLSKSQLLAVIALLFQ